MLNRRPLTWGITAGLLVVVVIIWFLPPGRYPPSRRLVTVPTLAQLSTSVAPILPSLTTTAFPETAVLPPAAGEALQNRPTISPNALQHVVRRGETLYRIALDYGVTAETLALVNGLADPGRILVGQQLVIPEGGIAPTVPSVLITPTDSVTMMVSTPPATSIILPPTPLYPTPNLPALSPPESTSIPSATVLPGGTPDSIAFASPPSNINGVPVDAIIVLPENVRQNLLVIYAQGQALGRNPRAFSKLGDSTIENPHFLTRFDGGPYSLGPYAYLQPVIDYFQGSFGRQGVAVRRGLHSWSVFDPMWGDKSFCTGGESVLACELRLNNPAFLFVRLGSNDVGVPDSFDRNLRQVVEFALQNGVIPIIGTKADRHEGAGNVNNNLLRQIALDYQVPLWDFDLVAATLPGRGLGPDGVHMTTFFAHDYGSPLALQRGNGVHSLTALMALDAVWRAVNSLAP